MIRNFQFGDLEGFLDSWGQMKYRIVSLSHQMERRYLEPEGL